jgi:hypothetical protein
LRVLGRRQQQHIYRSKSPNLYPPKLNQIPCLANNATTLQGYAFKMTSQWCHIGQGRKETNKSTTTPGNKVEENQAYAIAFCKPERQNYRHE